MDRYRLRPLLLAALLAAASCTMVGDSPFCVPDAATARQPAETTPQVISIATSLDTLSLAHELLEAHAGGGQPIAGEMVIDTPAGIAKAVLASRTDLGLVLLPISGRQPLRFPDAWADADPVLLGWDAVVIVIHPLRQVKGWDRATLAAVLRGKLHDWAHLGSGAGTISLLGRADGAPSREALTRYAGIAELSPRLELLPDDDVICSSVGARPLAVGWVTLSSLTDQCRPLTLEGVLPTTRTVRSGDYAPRLAVVLLTAPDASWEAQALARWARGPQGQRVIARRYAPAS